MKDTTPDRCSQACFIISRPKHSELKLVFVRLGVLLVSLVLGSWFMGYFLTKARDVESPVSCLLRCGTGEDWVNLRAKEKREVCEEAARRFRTHEPEIAVIYYLYLENVFDRSKLRNSLISDVLIDAEMRKLEIQRKPKVKLPIEIPDTIIWNSRLTPYIGLS